jgi:hypothetical protein
MGSIKAIYYASRVFQVGQFAGAIESLLMRLGASPDATHFTLSEMLIDGTGLDRDVTLRELDSICDLSKQRIDAFIHPPESMPAIHFEPTPDGMLRVLVNAPTTKLLADVHTMLSELLGLEPLPNQNRSPIIQMVNAIITRRLGPTLKRLDAIEQTMSANSGRLHCFLSYRFNDTNELLALRVQQFLNLLDVEVVTGTTYEPRKVSEKVLSKLHEPLDFIVLLITGDGESMWTRDEIAAAIHRGIPLVPLIEKGATLQQGLFGDNEYVQFEAGHVGDAFLKLLQAVRFVRQRKTVSLAREESEPVNDSTLPALGQNDK